MVRSILYAVMIVAVPVFNIKAQQRIVAECTITYNLSADSGMNSKDYVQSLKESSKTVYIKGNNCRIDLLSPAFLQSTFYYKTDGTAIILREFGNNKFMTKIDKSGWIKENSRYEGLTINLTEERKIILGYECRKATIVLKDNSIFNLYFAVSIAPSVKEFEYQFKDIPGLVLEYEVKDNNGNTIRYTATKVNLSPVPASRFEIQTAGYRLLD